MRFDQIDFSTNDVLVLCLLKFSATIMWKIEEKKNGNTGERTPTRTSVRRGSVVSTEKDIFKHTLNKEYLRFSDLSLIRTEVNFSPSSDLSDYCT